MLSSSQQFYTRCLINFSLQTNSKTISQSLICQSPPPKKKGFWHRRCPSIFTICLSQSLKDSHCSSPNPPNLQHDSEVNHTLLCQYNYVLYYPPTGATRQFSLWNNAPQNDSWSAKKTIKCPAVSFNNARRQTRVKGVPKDITAPFC